MDGKASGNVFISFDIAYGKMSDTSFWSSCYPWKHFLSSYFILFYSSLHFSNFLELLFASISAVIPLYFLIHENRMKYTKTLRYTDFGPKSISAAQKTVYLEVIWKLMKTVYLWGFCPKTDKQCHFWQNLKPWLSFPTTWFLADRRKSNQII